MIAYHPAFDPYHTAFRIVRLLVAQESALGEAHTRILDFHLVFPEAVQHITLPQALVRWRRYSRKLTNQYWFNGERWMVFARMKPIFDAAVGLLYSSSVIDRDLFKQGLLRTSDTQPNTAALLDAAREQNERDKELINFLVNSLGRIKLTGPDGLKDRTGLLEFKYDAV